jgi:hypothetical protein
MLHTILHQWARVAERPGSDVPRRVQIGVSGMTALAANGLGLRFRLDFASYPRGLQLRDVPRGSTIRRSTPARIAL